jgi:hypothetical protein
MTSTFLFLVSYKLETIDDAYNEHNELQCI